MGVASIIQRANTQVRPYTQSLPTRRGRPACLPCLLRALDDAQVVVVDEGAAAGLNGAEDYLAG